MASPLHHQAFLGLNKSWCSPLISVHLTDVCAPRAGGEAGAANQTHRMEELQTGEGKGNEERK